ncbi:MAG: hypothetical protein ACXVCD_18390 [Pseudobdellovibrionaceae bacterium]
MKNSGLSVLEILIGLGLLSVFIVMSLIFSQSINHSSENGRVQATRDRLILRVRNVCGMAAALRNSIKAALPSGTTSINQDLNNCVTGAQGAVCQNNQVYPLTLFSPTLEMDSSGNPMGLLPVTSPPGSPTPSYYDIFGAACAQGSPNCVFIITTSFKLNVHPRPFL